MTDRGAHFFRCDFQVHTPRDTNWRGDRPTDDAERLAWAESLVAACRKKDLHAIAVTDHHDFAMVPFVRNAAQGECGPDGRQLPEEQRLSVFPGLELTLSVPCQAILILDSEFPADRLDGVLARLAVQIVDPAQVILPSVRAIDLALLSELYTELDKEPWLRNRYIVFPNVTDGGHQTLLRSHMHHKYREMPCVGGYLDGTVESKVGTGNRRIFDGLNPDYGNKRLALIQTSDSRNATFDDLGKHSTWIKWSVPTAEALRQACLSQESRICQVQPELPTIWVSRLLVDNSMFLGPIDLELSHEFNAIIGGRGTGKSTLLDYLRWALCDLPTSAGEEEIGDPAVRQRRLITTTLGPTESTVEVHFAINDIPHIVRRNAKSGDVTLKVGDADFLRVREAEVRELLPIQAYSQKQLSSVSVRMEELTRFVTSPIRRALADIDQKIQESAGRIRENYATLQRKRQLEGTIRRLELSEKSLFDQAANLRASLTDVTDSDREILGEKPTYDAAEAVVDGWNASAKRGLDLVERTLSSVTELVTNLLPAGEVPAALQEPLLGFRTNTVTMLEGLSASLLKAMESIGHSLSTDSEHVRLYGQLREVIDAYGESYADVKSRSTAQAAKLTELAEVEKQHRSSGQQLRTQREELGGLGQPDADHSRLLREMFELMGERSTRLAQQCESLSEYSSGLLRASLQRGQGLTSVSDQFRAAVTGSSLRGNRIDDFFAQLGAEVSPLDTWDAAVREMEGLTLLDDDSPVTQSNFLFWLGLASCLQT